MTVFKPKPAFVPKPWAGCRINARFPELQAPDGTGEVILFQGRDAPALDLPLCVKLLDTSAPLSIQNHPSDNPETGERGKSEGWLVLDAGEGAYVLQGLREDTLVDEFWASVVNGSPSDLMNRRVLRRGDWLFNPSGLIHAVGPELLILEIQQDTDVTWRIYDFPRDSGPRELHLEQAQGCARYPSLPAIQHDDQQNQRILQQDGPFMAEQRRVTNTEIDANSIVVALAGEFTVTEGSDEHSLSTGEVIASDKPLIVAGKGEIVVIRPNG